MHARASDPVDPAWEAGPVLPSPAPVLGRLLEGPLARTPRAEALVAPARDGGTLRLTYTALDAAVSARASALAAAGVAPGDRVGLLATRDAALVPSLLALLRLGAAYVPLDPGAPAARWAQVAGVAGLRRVVGPAALAADPRLPAGVAVLGWEEQAGPGADVPPYDDPAAAAYVLFTSGSTGTPKGVVVPHRAVLARAASYLALTGPDALPGACRYLLHSSLVFDGAVGGMSSTLARGGCLVLPDDATAADPARAAALVAREGVTHVEPVPSWYAALLDLAAPGALASVRAAVLGGEVLPPALVARHRAVLPGAALLNDYGPTETTVAATVFAVPPGWAGPVPIGRPHANTTVRVLRADGSRAGIGEIGSLVVGGPCVADGYLGLPGSPAFGTDPDTGERTYVTGDLASWGPDGLLRFAGRADRQVKVRGQRVEPDEVEGVLAGVPGVGLCAVQVDRPEAGPRLVAYASPAAGASLDAGGLRAALGERLPAYAVPDLVVVLDALPLTPGGKVDRRALPAPGPAGAGLPGGPPRGRVEESVAAAVAAALDVPAVGRDQGLLASGGTSLGAARVAARLRADLGVDVTVADVLVGATPAGVAGRLEGRGADPAAALRRRARPAGEPWRAPATPQQQSFWLLESTSAGRGAANLVERLDLPVPVTRGALAVAVAGLVARHSALRTSFDLTGDRLDQVVASHVDVAVRDLAADEVDAVAAEPFDLAAAPLLRVGRVPGATGTTVVLVAHHAVADGWSLALLVEDLLGLLHSDRQDAGPDPAGGALPPAPAVEPLDVADWLAARPAAGVAAATRHAEALVDAARGDLDRLLPRPAGGGTALRPVAPRALDPALAAGVAALARASGATPFAVLAAALGAVLAHASGVAVPLLAVPVAGRGEPALERVVACLVNVVLRPVDTTGDPAFADLVRRLAAASAAGAEHDWLPFETALRERPDEARRLPVLLNLVDVPAPRLVLAGRPVSRRLPPPGRAVLGLDLDLEPDGAGGYRVAVSADPARVDAGAAADLTDTWLRLLAAAVEDPGAPVSLLSARAGGPIGVAAVSTLRAVGPAAGDDASAPSLRVDPRVAGLVRVAWTDLLGRAPGPGESFAAAGGHSLLAARLVARLRVDAGVDLDLGEFLAAPRVDDVAALLTARRAAVESVTPGPAGAAAPGGAPSPAPSPAPPPTGHPTWAAALPTGDLAVSDAEALLDDLDGLSDDEVEDLLNRLSA